MTNNDTFKNGVLMHRIAIDPLAQTVTTFERVNGELAQTDQREMTQEEIDAYWASQKQDPTEALLVAAQLSVADKIIGEELSESKITSLAPLFDPWRPGIIVSVGDLYSWDGTVVQCLQAHTTQSDWSPDAVPALWKIHRNTTTNPEPWVQPLGGHDAYQLGDLVTHNGQTWESTVNNNVWEPGIYGWIVKE
jgi:hypothetical protein